MHFPLRIKRNEPQMQIIIASVVAGLIATSGPLILAIITGRQRRRDKIEDWARQDQVAERLMNDNKKTADRLLEENKKTAMAVTETNVKIDGVAEQAHEIHGLVNSAMSAEMRRSLQSTQALVVVLEELMTIKGFSQESQDRINEHKAVIGELTAALNDRSKEG